MNTTQTPAAVQGEAARRGSNPVTFWFEKPSQDELRRRLAALDAARHATHTQPAWFCPLCQRPDVHR